MILTNKTVFYRNDTHMNELTLMKRYQFISQDNDNLSLYQFIIKERAISKYT